MRVLLLEKEPAPWRLLHVFSHLISVRKCLNHLGTSPVCSKTNISFGFLDKHKATQDSCKAFLHMLVNSKTLQGGQEAWTPRGVFSYSALFFHFFSHQKYSMCIKSLKSYQRYSFLPNSIGIESSERPSWYKQREPSCIWKLFFGERERERRRL